MHKNTSSDDLNTSLKLLSEQYNAKIEDMFFKMSDKFDNTYALSKDHEVTKSIDTFFNEALKQLYEVYANLLNDIYILKNKNK
jgi:hypothetical protein